MFCQLISSLQLNNQLRIALLSARMVKEIANSLVGIFLGNVDLSYFLGKKASTDLLLYLFACEISDFCYLARSLLPDLLT